jgi:hypothetical protein
MLNNRIITVFLAVGLVLALVLLFTRLAIYRLPGTQTGYEPDQPIKYSHLLHAGELGISCQYCHYGAKRSRYAGLPPASVCLNCHKFVTASWGAVLAENKLAEKEGRPAARLVSGELQKIYSALGFDTQTGRDSTSADRPLKWAKIHNLADFVSFDHRPHVAAGVACQRCHGPVETMERVRQVADLGMGWCIGCHRQSNADGVVGRQVHAPTDCAACHY